MASEPPRISNDNKEPPATISFTDLAASMGVDEDFLLRRLAKILNKRTKKEPKP